MACEHFPQAALPASDLLFRLRAMSLGGEGDIEESSAKTTHY